jgi:hypothetical protein
VIVKNSFLTVLILSCLNSVAFSGQITTLLECQISLEEQQLNAKVVLGPNLDLEYRLYKGKTPVGSCSYKTYSYRDASFSKIPRVLLNLERESCSVVSKNSWKGLETNEQGALIIHLRGARLRDADLNIFRSLDPATCFPKNSNLKGIISRGQKL